MILADSCPMPAHRPLPRDFYSRPPDMVARELIGALLISDVGGELTGGSVVETEAYFGPDDPASHAAFLRNGRVAAMTGPPGVAYVYRAYGIHAMLNPVAHAPGETGAVLIRAIEPLWGIETMRRRRGVAPLRQLCAGPGRLCQALGIGLDGHGHDLVGGTPFWLAAGEAADAVLVSGRIGVTRAAERPLRFFAAGSPYVSGHRRGTALSGPPPG